jgi:DNA repair exonuclease SbcCD ATPase subunit
MRPLKVEFQAFGPYAGHEMVDFEAISSKGLFLICGKTGIGKTMILDAMTFALFGKSSGHGRDNFEAMRCTNADFDTSTYVKFDFENHGEYYRFERRLERKRKNLSASYNVALKGDDGVWRPLMENAKETAVNSKAVEIIGLDYDQFRQVIILPQGQFERLLTSGSEEKEIILSKIFGERKWKNIADRFYDKAFERKRELTGIKDKISNSLNEEDCNSISQLELVVNHKKDEEKALDKEYEAAEYDKTIKEQQGLLAIAKRFSDLHTAENNVNELENQKEDRAAWEKTLNEARRADKVRALLDEEKKAATALATRQKAEKNARIDAENKKKASEEATKKVQLHAEKEKEIEELNTRKIQYEGKRQDYEGLQEEENELKRKKKAASVALAEEQKAKDASEAFVEVIARLNSEYGTLQDEHRDLLDAYLAGITGELAGQLKEGEPCPVCGSTVHPHKAKVAENSVTKAMVDSKKDEAEEKYEELKKQLGEQQKAKELVEEKHAAVEKANLEVNTLSERLDNRKKNLVEGIDTVDMLDDAIRKLQRAIEEYERQKKKLIDAEKDAQADYERANANIESAKNEASEADKLHKTAVTDLEKGLRDNKFESQEDAEAVMLDEDEMSELSRKIQEYDVNVNVAKENLRKLNAELEGKKEPDADRCQEIIEEVRKKQGDYRQNKGKLSTEIERLDGKLKTLMKEGDGIEEKIREAEEDFTFAKKLRGDSGTGLQRYVLGIMFSSVVAAANKMLEMVHGGRYRLYRSDEKAEGSNKRGLELKVFDKNSEEHDGRFVSTLSGGEKFLVSLALSIGMSTVAQKSGIKIEALFIDEGFGSLDDDSIADAMNVLNSIQEANGLVGIISHVQILQDQIPSKLRIEEDSKGSHIVQTVG